MYDFLRVFIDLFFYPLYSMSLDIDCYVLIYTVIIVLAVWSFVRRVLSCFNFI